MLRRTSAGLTVLAVLVLAPAAYAASPERAAPQPRGSAQPAPDAIGRFVVRPAADPTGAVGRWGRWGGRAVGYTAV